jgi:hypothetical protein
MSGLQTPITNINAPYNDIVSANTVPTNNNSNNSNNNPNISSTIQHAYDSGIIDNADNKSVLVSDLNNQTLANAEKSIRTQEETQYNSSDKILQLINGYLSGQIESSDNKNPLVTTTQAFDPLNKLVQDYLSNNQSMYDNKGKYFDQYLFNKKFDDYIEQKNKERLIKEKVKLNDLNQIENIKIEPYQLPLNKLLINIKDTWFNMYDNFINKREIINSDDQSQNDSFFYIGVTLIAIVLLYVTLCYIFN